MEPKNVFHHLKPLYKEELICHMQLAIPPGLKTAAQLGSEEAPRAARTSLKSNLSMSALLWSSAYFSLRRLPDTVRSLMAANHLLPLQQEAIELLRSAPNSILLEEEVRHFFVSKLLDSEQAS